MFLLPQPSQPRYHKRMNRFRKLGISPKIFSFEREYFEGKRDSLCYQSLGKIEHGNYCKRLYSLVKAFFLLKNEMAFNSFSGVYAFGLDLAFVGVLLKIFLRRKNLFVVYECADIQPLMLKSRLVRLVERWVIRKSTIIVTTSEGFVENYFFKCFQRQFDGF